MVGPARGWIKVLAPLWVAVALSTAADSQSYGDRLGQRRGGEVTFEPMGPGVVFDALDPTVKRWYVPQELYNDYGFLTWEYTNYSRESYQRYVNTTLEGEYFYDMFGSFVNRGWLIYDWRQEALTPLGSSIYQDSRYQLWFNQVLIAADDDVGITVLDRFERFADRIGRAGTGRDDRPIGAVQTELDRDMPACCVGDEKGVV